MTCLLCGSALDCLSLIYSRSLLGQQLYLLLFVRDLNGRTLDQDLPFPNVLRGLNPVFLFWSFSNVSRVSRSQLELFKKNQVLALATEGSSCVRTFMMQLMVPVMCFREAPILKAQGRGNQIPQSSKKSRKIISFRRLLIHN